ncbi:MAG: alpha/beta fold hydrolase [Spirochaetales bacterium]
MKPPIQEALPIRIDPAGAREAVLLLHGFSGYPGELAPLAEGLASAGYAVRAPRFPGHGTCQWDFLLTKAEDWTRSAFDAYLEARSEYGTVHVAGHSMGGLLASAIAISFDVPKLILLAPAFELAIKGIGLTRFVAPFKRVIAMNRPISAADSKYPERIALQPEYWADVMIGPAAELERLRKFCRKNIKRLKSRTLVIIGEADKTVSPNVVPYLRKAAPEMASFESHTIPGADHVFIFNEHSAKMLRLVLEWMTISL